MDGKGDFQNGQDSAKESSEQVAKLRETIGKYAPYVGAASGAIFGANLMSPNILSRPLGSKSVGAQNLIFALAHIGTGIYIHQHTPAKEAHHLKLKLYAVTGSVLFNYGTLLVLANIKHYLPQSQILRCLIGMGVVGGLFWTGKEYMSHMEASEVD